MVPDHFKQYRLIKSIKLLVQHVDHYETSWKAAEKVNWTAIREVEELRKELHNIRMQQIADPGTLDKLNNMFGMGYTKPTDN